MTQPLLKLVNQYVAINVCILPNYLFFRLQKVKSSGYKTHASLDAFEKKFSSRIGNRYLAYPKDLRKEQDLFYVPVFMTMLL